MVCNKLFNFSVEADAGTYSDITVQALSGAFTYGGINYGPVLPNTPFQGFRITNINGMGQGQVASFSITYTLSDGLQDQQVQAKVGSTFLLASFTSEDFQAVLDCQGQNIIPYYTPPEGGKVNDLIGAELTSLYYTYDSTGTYISDDIFQIVGSSVLIDVVADSGQYDSALALLIAPDYGMESYTGNPGQLTITGLFPILNLLMLNDLPDLINFARPVYTALANSGIVISQGDTSLRSHLSRTAFDLTGQGIKIGVMSDSYNTILGNPAGDDILRGDLPGPANADYPVPVDLIKEYPYGSRSDEGRAMLQIVHDVAPGAELAFRTGFLGPADFAKGIIELQQADCDIIVDDITYISEPFFRDGIVARAVDSVHSLGVTYFSAAGNFGSKAYESLFYPVAAPDSITGMAHNFAALDSGNDIYQSITLGQGNYTVVLQWDDGTPGNLTNSDFDIYLSNENGTTLFGFNRVNTGGAPIEVLPFTVTAASAQTNFMIIRASGTGEAMLKYIIFRGDVQVNEYASAGASTLVGQANAEGAIAVGAVLYSNTPEYGVDQPTVASFSSRGGTPVNGINRNKPEITAPNGVNTTVNLGGVNIDNDEFPNFFGTSAAAPHAAAVAALILEGKQKYQGAALSPDEIEELLQSTALDMYTPGYDAASGAGFIRADAALGALANPTPFISRIAYDTTLTPGIDTIELTVFGQFLTGESQIYFNGQPLSTATTALGDSAVISIIPTFTERYPMIQVYNPPMEGTNGTDGGLSEPLYFTSKETIVISIDDKSKIYGEILPGFTAEYYIENPDGNLPLDSADLSQEEVDRILGISFETIATALSNTGLWEIEADGNDPLNPESGLPVVDSLDIALLEKYDLAFENGLLTIEKLDLVISPKDTTITYGDEIGGFEFDFHFNNDSVNLDFGFEIDEPDSLAILSAFKVNYATALVNETALVNASSFITATALVNKSMMISNATFNQFATALVNGTFIGPPSFQTATALVNVVTFTGISALAPATALVNGDVVVNGFSSSGATALVNASTFINSFAGATALVNTNTVNLNNNSDAIVILSGGDISILSGDSTGNFDLRGINLITGNTVGEHFIVPGSFISNNFNISYMPGILTIVPDTATVIADLKWIYDNDPLPDFTATFSGFNEGDDESVVDTVTFTVSPEYTGEAGTYQIIPAAVSANYVFTPVNGTLYVNPNEAGTQQIKPRLVCVELLTEPDSSGFMYIANFAYDNDNATDIYIPAGSDNYFSGEAAHNPVNQPDLFEAGGGSFTVPFDGNWLIWNVKSYNSNGQKLNSMARANSSSTTCIKSVEAEAPVIHGEAANNPEVYPNPTSGRVYINLNGHEVTSDQVRIFDIFGKALIVLAESASDGRIELDLSSYAAGIYFIMINNGETNSVTRIIRK
jgi:hypothetical protein